MIWIDNDIHTHVEDKSIARRRGTFPDRLAGSCHFESPLELCDRPTASQQKSITVDSMARGTLTSPPYLKENDSVLLLRKSMLQMSKESSPVIGRCSSSSSLSEHQEALPCYDLVTEETNSEDSTLEATYTLVRRRSSELNDTENRVAPDSPGLRLRVKNSIDKGKERIGEMKRRLRPKQDRSKWLIPADHPVKILWDMLTVALSIWGARSTHASIRDRSFGHSTFVMFCEVWFLFDILLNFVTEHKTSEGHVIRDGKAVWARYLTTWFVVDALSLVRWEALYVKPIIEMQNRRNFFKKTFFRSRAVIRVTRVLRGRHLKLLRKVASRTRHAGVGANRLLRLLIKYVPKYLLFYRNMKGVLAVRTLRMVHWLRKVRKSLLKEKKEDDDTYSLSEEEYEEEEYELEEDDDLVHVFEYEGESFPVDEPQPQ